MHYEVEQAGAGHEHGPDVGTLRDLTDAFAKLGVTFIDGDKPGVVIDLARLGNAA